MLTSGAPDLLTRLGYASGQAEAKARLQAARRELVTGQRADLATAPEADQRGVLSLDRSLQKLAYFGAATAIARTRAGLAQASLGTVQSAAEDVGVSLLAAADRPDAVAVDTAVATARARLDQVFAALGVAAGGRSLFSGAAVDRPPLAPAALLVADLEAIVAAAPDAATALAGIDTYFTDPAGGFETAIYLGSDQDASGVDLGDGAAAAGLAPRANDPALRDLIRALATAAVAPAAGFAGDAAESSNFLRAAGEGVLTARDAVIGLRAGLGRIEERIGLAEAGNAAETDALARARNALAARDPYDAATEVQALEGQLQAIYTVTARLSQLSLASFLR